MKKIALILAITLSFLFSGAAFSQAQLGGLIGGKLTAESLNADLLGGLDFFAKATTFYAKAVLPAEKAKILEDALKNNDRATTEKAIMVVAKDIEEKAKQMIADKQKLTKEAQELVKKGNGECSKGVAKWAALGGALALSAKQGGQDTALLAAIPVAQQMIQDLPQLKRMNDTIKELNKLK